MSDDAVNHPKHYTFGGIEVIDAIEAWQLGFHLGNVVKYVARSEHKGRQLEDLQKARWYLDRKIEQLKAAEVSAEPEPGPERCPTCHIKTTIVSVQEGLRRYCETCKAVYRPDGSRVVPDGSPVAPRS